MAFDEGLAQRVREILDDTRGLVEKKMFGGVGFLVDGNMAVGVLKDEVISRVGPDLYEDCLAEPYARVFDLTGRAMKGWIWVSADGVEDDDALRSWCERGLTFAKTLPPK